MSYNWNVPFHRLDPNQQTNSISTVCRKQIQKNQSFLPLPTNALQKAHTVPLQEYSDMNTNENMKIQFDHDAFRQCMLVYDDVFSTNKCYSKWKLCDYKTEVWSRKLHLSSLPANYDMILNTGKYAMGCRTGEINVQRAWRRNYKKNENLEN